LDTDSFKTIHTYFLFPYFVLLAALLDQAFPLQHLGLPGTWEHVVILGCHTVSFVLEVELGFRETWIAGIQQERVWLGSYRAWFTLIARDGRGKTMNVVWKCRRGHDMRHEMNGSQ